MSRKEVLVQGPKWMQRLAHRVESEANANDLRCVFRTIQTPLGLAACVVMMPAPEASLVVSEEHDEEPPPTKRYPSSDAVSAVKA